MLPIAVALAALLLAYANGANDNFKGVATLLGSATANYRRALLWATLTTAGGSITALALAQGLLAAFSGNGLVPPEVVANPVFPVAVALGAGLTVLVATRLGFPISTTHALVGALLGAGLVASPTGVDAPLVARSFLIPLLASPLMAVAGASLAYPGLRALRRRLGIEHETCICLGTEVIGIVPGSPGRKQALRSLTSVTLSSGTVATCEVRYQGELLGVAAGPALDVVHYVSAGAASFARGLNDTPKIAALLLVGQVATPPVAVAIVAITMAVGGLISARRVADTMAHRVTTLNAGQGVTANLITAALVIGASRFGVPVSTTHISCGSLFGIGAVTGQAHWKMIGAIALAWVVTLPTASVLSAAAVPALRWAGL